MGLKVKSMSQTSGFAMGLDEELLLGNRITKKFGDL